MCRLSAFFGAPICAADLVTRPSRSIITQSFDARERLSGDASTPGYLNGDGFGLGWYSSDPGDPLPCVYRQARPAWNDANLAMIAQKIYSRLLFAHVRAASPGMDVSQTTCHPFHFGRYLWMHNGGVGGFREVRRVLLPRLCQEAFDFAVTNGSSDSALCFAVFLNLVPDKMGQSTPDEMRDRVDRTIGILRDAIMEAKVQELSLLNFVVSDGDSLVASRVVIDPKNPDAPAASLYHASGNRYVADSHSSDYHMVHVDRRATLAMVSSEPLTEYRNDWVAVPRNHLLVFTPSLHVLHCEVSQNVAGISRLLQNLQLDGVAGLPAQSHRAAIASGLTVDKLAEDAGQLVRKDSISGNDRLNSTVLAGFGAPTTPVGNRIDTKPTPQQDAVFHRAIMSQTTSTKHGAARHVNLEPLPVATLSPGPARSTIRYEIQTTDHAILSMVVCGPYLCAGTQDGSIRVWHIENRAEVTVLRRHGGAILVLAADEEGGVLVSGSSGSEICVWKMRPPDEFQCVLIIPCAGNGGVFSVAVVNRILYAGFSDTLVRRLDRTIDRVLHDWSCKKEVTECSNNGLSDVGLVPAFVREGGDVRDASGTARRESLVSKHGSGISRLLRSNSGSATPELEHASEQARHSRHYGYVFCLVECKKDELMCSGCGDGLIRVWDVKSSDCVRSLEGHAGAVLAMAVTTVPEGTLLFSGSRDRTIRVWDADSGFLCKRTIRKHKEEIVSCSASTDIVLTGSADGQVYLWCARTLHCLAQYRNSSLQVAAISVPHDFLFLATDNCKIQVRDLVQFDVYGNKASVTANGPCGAWQFPSLVGSTNAPSDVPPKGASNEFSGDESRKVDDDGTALEDDESETLVPGVPNEIVLAPPSSPLVGGMAALKLRGSDGLVAGSMLKTENDVRSDGFGTSDKRGPEALSHGNLSAGAVVDPEFVRRVEERFMQDVFKRFVSIPTVSGRSGRREDCWQGAKYLSTFLEGIGANVKMISSEGPSHGAKPGHNPIILARFSSTQENAKTLAFYGHYDVMPAEAKDWDTNPWELTPIDGHFYGRGTTDNKGPILAMVFAIKSLLEGNRDGLGMNIVLILEGEGENANEGFREALCAHRHLFGETSMILTSNSYWIGEEKPCLTYGMRGVIELDVHVSGGSRNLHSGVDGGAIYEPVSDLLGILGTLLDSHGMALVPGFYDDVRPLTLADKARFADVHFELSEYQTRTGVNKFTSSNPIELLEARWRHPSISIASLDTSNKDSVFSVMPREASAKLSIRFVPDQSPDKLIDAVKTHLRLEFSKRRSMNTLSVSCVGKGDWWLEDPNSDEFQLAACAVKNVWGVDPLYVCEGGSMPIFSFMSKTLDAPVVQVPLGQASDAAHLPNERIRAMNLFRGKEVLRHIVRDMNLQQKRKRNGVECK